MAAFKKGDKVIMFGNWSRDTGSTYYRYLTVMSCGKQQMTCFDEAEGKMIKDAIRASRYDDIVLASDCADPVAIGLERSAAFIQETREHFENCLIHNPDASDAYKKAIRADIESHAGNVPSTSNYNDLLAQLRAKHS